ncbi:MAG: D-tyrosyl-tRNA(Tyr) deacylase [Clostridia bacterium]|nr:D-tyrosyl-tRNA(Tyr) deacylase [Clostridia bacterium]
MKLVVTRVNSASVTIDGKVHSEIEKGLLVLMGVTGDDTIADAEYLAQKLPKLRIFEDEEGKLNRSVLDVGGEVLIVSNFTLYADASHGNRPSFTSAARGEISKPLYDAFCDLVSKSVTVKCGVFGGDMKVASVNDGPVTIIMESRKKN